MKITIIQPRTPYHVAGSEKVSLKHAEFLSKLGHQIDYYTSIPKNKDETFLFKEFIIQNLPGINILRFDISKSIPNLYEIEPDTEHIRWVTESIAFNEKIYDELKKNKPDIILSYYLPDSMFKPSGIPNVIYLSGYPSQPVLWYKSFIKFCDATISISSNVADKWADEIKEVKLNYILGTGVDYPLPVLKKIEPKAKYNLVYAGRLIERKGVLTLLEAYKKISDENHDTHLWILGDGELKQIMEEKIMEYNLQDKITMTGLISNPYDYFTMADICIFPSHKGDGLMGTILESMAAGKPVITTTNNGNEDVITNGDNGILIDPGNIEELANTIKDLLTDEQKRIAMGKKAKNFIEENVAWEKNIKKLDKILNEISRN
ncbi:MAG: glycosyltransferase family 4 protein [Patescibacteria group bacterium]